jgi:hypothetical protein
MINDRAKVATIGTPSPTKAKTYGATTSITNTSKPSTQPILRTSAVNTTTELPSQLTRSREDDSGNETDLSSSSKRSRRGETHAIGEGLKSIGVALLAMANSQGDQKLSQAIAQQSKDIQDLTTSVKALVQTLASNKSINETQ